MSVATEIQRIKTAIANAYTAVSGKGGTVPQSAVVGNLATAIGTISTGTPLPTLTNPAAAGDILLHKEAIDGNGDKLTGSLVIANTLSLTEDPTVANGVLSVEVESSKETGTKTFTVSVPDAIPENIVAGKEILGVTGTYEGGGAEHNSGTFTMAADSYSTFSIEHGLSKKPKLFVFHMDGYQDIAESTYNIYCLATPEAAVVIKGTPDSTPKSAYMTTPYFEPTCTKVFLDATAVTFGTASYNWKAGDYVWEAWTW